MRFSTFNICGWKSAIKNGLIKWIKRNDIDVLAIQELRTIRVVKPLGLMNYFTFFNPSKFQGTALISKIKPMKLIKKIGYERFDEEGRFIQAEFENFIFINVYLPHGKRDKKELPYKLSAYDALIKHLSELLKRSEKSIIIGGDFNVAHKEIDLARPKENENNIMFTKEEREKITRLIKFLNSANFRHYVQI